MIRRIFHTIFSLWLAMLLLFGVAPKEILHSFAHHKDTIHQHQGDGPVVENTHHHCSFLNFQLLPFAAPMQLPFLRSALATEYYSFLPAQDERASQQIIALREGRGPPVA